MGGNEPANGHIAQEEHVAKGYGRLKAPVLLGDSACGRGKIETW